MGCCPSIFHMPPRGFALKTVSPSPTLGPLVPFRRCSVGHPLVLCAAWPSLASPLAQKGRRSDPERFQTLLSYKTSRQAAAAIDFSQWRYFVPGAMSNFTLATPAPSCPRFLCFSMSKCMRFKPKKCVPYLDPRNRPHFHRGEALLYIVLWRL